MRVAISITTIPSFWKLVEIASESPYVERAQESTSSAVAVSRFGKYTNLYQDTVDRSGSQVALYVARVLSLSCLGDSIVGRALGLADAFWHHRDLRRMAGGKASGRSRAIRQKGAISPQQMSLGYRVKLWSFIPEEPGFGPGPPLELERRKRSMFLLLLDFPAAFCGPVQDVGALLKRR
jgi:hypothetical protein